MEITSITPPCDIHCRDISVVIPVKNNQTGISRFLDKLVEVTEPSDYPCEVIIVDNNSTPPICLELDTDYPIPVKLLSCISKGPAAARNTGVSQAKGEWILFTDSDCIPTATTLSGYRNSNNRAIAYAGNIEIVSNDPLSDYYRTRETLIPPPDKHSPAAPLYLVTANSLMLKHAIIAANGFNERFKQAGGEDVDMAWRLKSFGSLEYCKSSITQHEFDDGFKGMVKRFIRYGRGNKQLQEFHNIPMFPVYPEFIKKTFSHEIFACVEYFAMIYGYRLGEIRE